MAHISAKELFFLLSLLKRVILSKSDLIKFKKDRYKFWKKNRDDFAEFENDTPQFFACNF